MQAIDLIAKPVGDGEQVASRTPSQLISDLLFTVWKLRSTVTGWDRSAEVCGRISIAAPSEYLLHVVRGQRRPGWGGAARSVHQCYRCGVSVVNLNCYATALLSGRLRLLLLSPVEFNLKSCLASCSKLFQVQVNVTTLTTDMSLS